MVEVQYHFESHCRKPRASTTIGRNEKDKQTAKDSNDGSVLLGFSFPILESWCTSFVIVKPDTVVRWHSKGIKLFWKFKSKGPGRPKMDHEIRRLVREMAMANPSWGAQDSWGIAQAGFQCFIFSKVACFETNYKLLKYHPFYLYL